MFISYTRIVLRTLTVHKIALFHDTDTSLSYLLNDNATQQFKKNYIIHQNTVCVYKYSTVHKLTSRLMKHPLG